MQHVILSSVKMPFELIFSTVRSCFGLNPTDCSADTTFDMVSIEQTFHLAISFNICLAFKSCIPSTCYQIWCFFSSEQPLHTTNTLWCSYIPASEFFYLYPLRWAMSPRQPSLTTQTHSHSFCRETHTGAHIHKHTYIHTRCELRLRWRLEGFINSVSDHMN